MLKFIIFSTVILLSFVSNSLQDAPEVQISTGKLKGEDKESRDDRDFFAYRGIPYAKARRFEPPQKPDNWTDVLNAKEFGKKCIQYSTYEKKTTGSETCLFINVVTPKIGDGISKKLLPVMVFIHGGFMDGTSEIYRGHYFMDQDVVIVTFNYRLNAFGFLSTGDDVIPGNMGLKDQIMALRWVQENIRKFAGDPQRVTLFGAGDGASSVQFLMLSQSAKGRAARTTLSTILLENASKINVSQQASLSQLGLFRKAITQSGNALKLSVIQRRPKEAAQRLARLLDCSKILNETENATKTSDCTFENSTLILECLRLVDAKKLAEVQKESFGLFSDPLSFFGPVIEKPSADPNDIPFLTEHPYSIISSGRQSRVPWMTGINAQEGLITTGVILNDKTLEAKIDAHWPQLSPHLLKYDWSRTDITDKIRRFYLSERGYEFVTSAPALQQQHVSNGTAAPTIYPHLQVPAHSVLTPNLTILGGSTTSGHENEDLRSINFEEQFKGFTDLFTDRFYAVPMYEAVQMQSKLSPVYVYYNQFEGQFSLLDVYTGKTKDPAPALKKVSNWFKKNILGRKPQVPKHMGVCNGDELPLLFKYPELKIKENTKDYQMSKDLVKLWVQFAVDETKMTFQNSAWLPVSPSDASFQVMKFGNTPEESGMKPVSETFLNRMKFWRDLKYLAPFDQQ